MIMMMMIKSMKISKSIKIRKTKEKFTQIKNKCIFKIQKKACYILMNKLNKKNLIKYQTFHLLFKAKIKIKLNKLKVNSGKPI